MGKVNISKINFEIINEIVAQELANNIQAAEQGFEYASSKYTSAFAWVECAWVYKKHGEYTHAGIAYLLAASICIAKQNAYFVRKNYTEAAVCFFQAGNRDRHDRCFQESARYLPCGPAPIGPS